MKKYLRVNDIVVACRNIVLLQSRFSFVFQKFQSVFYTISLDIRTCKCSGFEGWRLIELYLQYQFSSAVKNHFQIYHCISITCVIIRFYNKTLNDSSTFLAEQYWQRKPFDWHSEGWHFYRHACRKLWFFFFLSGPFSRTW